MLPYSTFEPEIRQKTPQTWLQNAPELPVLADNGNGHSEEQRTINDAVKAF
jgi:hypothetical protein